MSAILDSMEIEIYAINAILHAENALVQVKINVQPVLMSATTLLMDIAQKAQEDALSVSSKKVQHAPHAPRTVPHAIQNNTVTNVLMASI